MLDLCRGQPGDHQEMPQAQGYVSIQANPYLHEPHFQNTNQLESLLPPFLQVEATSWAAACLADDWADVDMCGSKPSLVQPALVFPSPLQPHAAAAQRAQHAAQQGACSLFSGLSMAAQQSHAVAQVNLADCSVF